MHVSSLSILEYGLTDLVLLRVQSGPEDSLSQSSGCYSPALSSVIVSQLCVSVCVYAMCTQGGDAKSVMNLCVSPL